MVGQGILVVLWIIVMIVAFIAEALTTALVSVWFGIGALAAVIAALCGANLFVQMVVFVTVSLIALALTRPIVRKLMPGRYIYTNGEDDIGKTAIVIETVDPAAGTGRIRLGDVDWATVSEDGSVIPVNCVVTIAKKSAAHMTVRIKGGNE